jgi:hypothetical protein
MPGQIIRDSKPAATERPEILPLCGGSLLAAREAGIALARVPTINRLINPVLAKLFIIFFLQTFQAKPDRTNVYSKLTNKYGSTAFKSGSITLQANICGIYILDII